VQRKEELSVGQINTMKYEFMNQTNASEEERRRETMAREVN
jgi:hypothetical protein